MAVLRTSPIPLAYKIEGATGVETIIHMTTRDRNVLALQSELLGAHLLGLGNILALTGDPPHVGDHPNAKGVYELWGNELINLAKTLNSGRAHSGGALDAATDFKVATALNVAATDEKTLSLLKAKIDAGVDFFQTQAAFDPQATAAFLQRQPIEQPILLGLIPPRNLQALEALAKIPGVSIPEQARQKLQAASDFEEAAVEWLTDVARQSAPFVDGIHIMPVTANNPVAHRLLDALADLRGQATNPLERNLPLPKETIIHG
jgi:5,10-methylenetetrahydrofolate reductase